MTFGCVWTAHLYFTNGAYATEMSSEQHMLQSSCVDGLPRKRDENMIKEIAGFSDQDRKSVV